MKVASEESSDNEQKCGKYMSPDPNQRDLEDLIAEVEEEQDAKN